MFEALKCLFSKKPSYQSGKTDVSKIQHDKNFQLLALNSRISAAFTKIRDDTNRLSQWVIFLNKRQDEIQERLNVELKVISANIARSEQEKNASLRTLATKADFIQFRESLASSLQWNVHLNSRLAKTDVVVKELSDKLDALSNDLKNLSELRDQDRGPAAGIASTISVRTQTPELRDVIVDDTQLRGVTGLSSSERSVLEKVYISHDPVTYSQISSKTMLNYGTVKNIICRLRKKGFSVENQVNPFGEKEFFILKSTKLAMSGR